MMKNNNINTGNINMGKNDWTAGDDTGFNSDIGGM